MEAMEIIRVSKVDIYKFNHNDLDGNIRKVYDVDKDNVRYTLKMIFVNYNSPLTDDLILLLFNEYDLDAGIITHEFEYGGKLMLSDITRHVNLILKGVLDE